MDRLCQILEVSRTSYYGIKSKYVGHAISHLADSALVTKALEYAYQSRCQPKGVLFHSDQGSQYTSRCFSRCLWRYRMTQSLSRRGNCWDTAPMERFFRSLKSEWNKGGGYQGIQEAKHDINNYIIGY